MKAVALAFLIAFLAGCVPHIQHLAGGVEGDLTLVTEFRLSEIKRR